MKNIILVVIFTLVTLMSFSPFPNNLPPLKPKKQIAYKICQEISERFKEKYHLTFSAIWEEGPDGKYKSIGLYFNYPRLLTKEEGRQLLLECGKEMLDAFNSHPEFEEYMDRVPFTYNNISLSISVRPSENFDVYAPNIERFSLLCERICYYKEELIDGKICDSAEVESLEEAMKIVEQSKLAKEKNAEPENRKG